MTTSVAEAKPAPPATATTGPGVWEQLWRKPLSDAADDAQLARERRSPRWTALTERLEATFGRIADLRTLELGSGRGDLSALLAERGAQVTLLDYSTTALNQARRRFDRLGLEARYARDDLLGPLDKLRGSFDVALSSGVIEHFKGYQRTRALQAHYRVLNPRGFCLISVPHAWCIPYRIWKLYLEVRGWWPYGMEIPFSRTELTRRARAAGFARSETPAVGFWQALGDHWGRSILGRGPDWVDKPSCCDQALGLNLLLFAWCQDMALDGRAEANEHPGPRRS